MKEEKLTIDDIQEEVDTFMFEGHDTTAAAITFFCYLMGCYPDVQRKVQEEIDSIFGDDDERECTTDDIQQMTYLDCAIKVDFQSHGKSIHVQHCSIGILASFPTSRHDRS